MNFQRFVVLVAGVTVFVGGADAASTSDQRGNWRADANGTCIMLRAEITFDLKYILIDTEATGTGSITIPKSATTEGSDCSVATTIEDEIFISQVLQLNFGSPYIGWSARFAFTNSDKINLQGNEYSLYQINVTANYSSASKYFPNAANENHTYVQPVSLQANSTNELAAALYGNLQYSFYCPSKQSFDLVPDSSYGMPFTVTIKYLQVEAYLDNRTSFSTKQTCAQDQKVEDLVPLITGGVLAGLCVLTLAVYLIYRSRLPPEVLHLTNPNSHFENLSFTHEKEDDAEPSGDHRPPAPHEYHY